ncbi:MAG TPA: hypothetical protein VJA25_00240, partial [Dehalococcoidia bacterium]|nr:hypothetical protein [Dehalococcoidia bacterium]
MPPPIVAALIIAGTAAATTTAQMVQSNQARQQAKGEANQQRSDMLRMRQEELARQGQMETKEAEAQARTA